MVKPHSMMESSTHRMDRRSYQHHYCWAGVYHLTMKVSGDLRQPLGRVVGSVGIPDGEPGAPVVELSEMGKMVEYELTHSITRHYPMIEVQEYVVMPEHLHAILAVKSRIVSASGRETHLGQVIAGFKKGCNRRYWEYIEQRGKPAATRMPAMDAERRGTVVDAERRGAVVDAERWGTAVDGGAEGSGVDGGSVCLSVYPKGYKVPSNGTTGRKPLFAYGYVDVMPLDAQQLEQQRRYIRNNPRSRLMRTENREWLQPKRLAVPTAVSLVALRGYLQRECLMPSLDEDRWSDLQSQILLSNGQVVCDSYGNRQLLDRRLLPVVCHRKDASFFSQQKERCLSAACEGAVLVSARISKGEQTIMDEAVSNGCPVVLVKDNGFPMIYHPSEHDIVLCAESRLLLVTPWKYKYRAVGKSIGVEECKTMNCIAQALCRQKDSWWKR